MNGISYSVSMNAENDLRAEIAVLIPLHKETAGDDMRALEEAIVGELDRHWFQTGMDVQAVVRSSLHRTFGLPNLVRRETAQAQ
jgi:hypothetical protein